MLKKLNVTMILALLGGCASTPPEPEPEPAPPPVEIAEAPEPGPPPDQPPPPDLPQKPPQTDTGMFRISIAALDSAAIAAPWVSKAEAAGYRTEVLAVEIDGKTWHRVLLPGYASLDDAKTALPFIQQELAPDAWITSRRRAPGPEGGAADAPPPPPPAPEEQEPTPAN